jgi:hypothetical protein
MGAVLQRPGNAGSYQSAWWDSNLQPDRYVKRRYEPIADHNRRSVAIETLRDDSRRTVSLMPDERVRRG